MTSSIKKNVLSLMVITAIALFGFTFSSSTSSSMPGGSNDITGKTFGGGAVEIHAGANLQGCVTGNGVSIPFTTDGSGVAYVSGLSAGRYTICVENWGAATFYNDGASEGVVNVPNNVDCTC